MYSYWLTFTDGSQACCDGSSPYHARKIAEKLTGKTVKGGPQSNSFDVKILPYPAAPSIWRFDCPVSGTCPSFCYTPAECAGHMSCCRSYSCVD